MEEYIISVGKIEELQMLNDKDALDAIFYKAKITIVGGETVALIRESSGKSYRFDSISNLDDLETYKKNVYKYVK
jgi:hypothetical protein